MLLRLFEECPALWLWQELECSLERLPLRRDLAALEQKRRSLANGRACIHCYSIFIYVAMRYNMELIVLAEAMSDSEDGRGRPNGNYETKPPSWLFSMMTLTSVGHGSSRQWPGVLDGLLEQLVTL
jgi:hypothetical protein